MHHAVKAALVSVGISFLGVGSASANQFFDFSYSRAGVPVSGVLEGMQPSADAFEWLAVGITGTRAGAPILSLISAGGFGANDNLFYIGTTPQLNLGGIAYQTANGSFNFYLGGGYLECTGACSPEKTGSLITGLSITPQSVSVPLPASLALLGLGLFGLSVSRARRSA